MFLSCDQAFIDELRFPRIRGDVPAASFGVEYTIWFSPHTRGCSGDVASLSDLWGSFPRIRGDVPGRGLSLIFELPFSPHTRGCSARRVICSAVAKVFPAYAGMFPGRK